MAAMKVAGLAGAAGELINATQNNYLHSFETATIAMRLAREGSKPFFSQYLLNPSAEFSDLYFVCTMFVILCVTRFVLAGAHHHRTRHSPSVFKILFGRFSKPKRDSKMCENLWYSCWHTFSFCFGCYVLYTEALSPEYPGWTRLLVKDFDVAWYWFPTVAETKFLGNVGWPLFPVSNIMKTYYLTELAFWLSCIVYLWIETIRDDFHALLLHHIVTCTLIGFSYICSFWRIGSVILLTHDVADIILYSAKTVHYTKVPPLVVDILFLVFVCGFFFSRLVFFPLFCLRPVLDVVKLNELSGGSVQNHWSIPGGITLPGFLCILQMLHIFWFGLIIKMVMRTFRGDTLSKVGDIRSDDENDAPDMGEEKEELEPEEKDSGSESNCSSGVGSDQRMRLSSLPGVRATIGRHRRESRRSVKSGEDSEHSVTTRSRLRRAQKSTQND